MNNIIRIPDNYSSTLKEKVNESDKEIKKDTISLNGLNNLNNKFINSQNSNMIYGANNNQNFFNKKFQRI